jgi:putative ABC transport system ATP-binding protein
LTVGENLALIAKHHKDAISEDTIESLLVDFGLLDRVDHLPSELSIGQRRRLAIVRCLLAEPVLVLADEPTNDLDERWREKIIASFAGIASTKKRSVVMVTHDESYAARAMKKYRLTELGGLICAS